MTKRQPLRYTPPPHTGPTFEYKVLRATYQQLHEGAINQWSEQGFKVWNVTNVGNDLLIFMERAGPFVTQGKADEGIHLTSDDARGIVQHVDRALTALSAFQDIASNPQEIFRLIDQARIALGILVPPEDQTGGT
jgi:hypothetical protein